MSQVSVNFTFSFATHSSISYSWPLIMTSVSLKMVGKPGALYELLGVCFVLTC